MSTFRQASDVSPILLRSLVVILVLLVIVVGWKRWSPGSNSAVPVTVAKPAPTPVVESDDPSPSFELVHQTGESGGDERTRQLAIVWLDTWARDGQPLPAEQEAWLLGTLRSGGHPDWEPAYRQWFFNSAFNALHHGVDPQPLTRLLADLARTDSDTTMRLYALQHIGTQRTNRRLSGASASEVHAILQGLLQRDPAIAGTVIELLASWDGDGAPVDPDTRKRAAAMAEDTNLGTDVRVTALHAAGSDSLTVARRLALASDEPVVLRKAAIACIGRHGGEQDVPGLEKLSRENSRLAQAADPARISIRNRLSQPAAAAPQPL